MVEISFENYFCTILSTNLESHDINMTPLVSLIEAQMEELNWKLF